MMWKEPNKTRRSSCYRFRQLGFRGFYSTDTPIELVHKLVQEDSLNAIELFLSLYPPLSVQSRTQPCYL
jgi:hypothetical protein